jgi:hypothetical protein
VSSSVGNSLKSESPELASAKRGPAEVAIAVELELVYEACQRASVAELEADHVERHAHELAHPRLPAASRDALVHSDERRKEAAHALHVPDAVELAHG